MSGTTLSLDFRIKAASDEDNVLAGGEQTVMLEIINSSTVPLTLLGREGAPPSENGFTFAPELWLRPAVLVESSLDGIRAVDRSWRATVTKQPDGCIAIGLVRDVRTFMKPRAPVSIALEGVRVRTSAEPRISQVQLAYHRGSRGTPVTTAARVHSLRIVASERLPFINAQASSFLDAPFNGLTRTAGRLIEYPASGTPWNSDRGDAAPWFWVELAKLSRIHSLTLAWGARPASYRVLWSVDGVSWTDTGVTGAVAKERVLYSGLHELPGWTSPTRFIKVEATLDANLPYVNCASVLATGVEA